MGEPATIESYTPSFWDAVRESVRLASQLSPMEAGLETTLPTQPLHEYLQSPPPGTPWLGRQLAGLAAPFVPGTRGDVVSAVGQLPMMLGAGPGGGAAAGFAEKGLMAGERVPGAVFDTAAKEAAFMREVLRAARARGQQPAGAWGQAGGKAVDLVGNPAAQFGTRMMASSAAQAAGVGGSTADWKKRQAEWARSLRKRLGDEPTGDELERGQSPERSWSP